MLKPSYIDFVKPYMLKPITNAREAVEFICHLYLDHNMFHFETHPEDLLMQLPSNHHLLQPK